MPFSGEIRGLVGRGSCDRELGAQNLTPGFRAGHYREGNTDAGEHGADQHRDRKPEMPIDCEIGDHRSGQAAKNRTLVINEAACRRAHFGREPLGEVSGVQRVHAATAERPCTVNHTTIIV